MSHHSTTACAPPPPNSPFTPTHPSPPHLPCSCVQVRFQEVVDRMVGQIVRRLWEVEQGGADGEVSVGFLCE